MLRTARQDTLYDYIVGIIPCSSASIRITGMPRNCYDAATLHVGNQFLTNARKWNGVEILFVTHLNATEVKAHHGRIVTNSLFYVTSASVTIPIHTVKRIILMTDHIAPLLQGGKAVE